MVSLYSCTREPDPNPTTIYDDNLRILVFDYFELNLNRILGKRVARHIRGDRVLTSIYLVYI